MKNKYYFFLTELQIWHGCEKSKFWNFIQGVKLFIQIFL